MKIKEKLISDCLEFMDEFHIAPTEMSRVVMKDPSFFTRLQKPGQMVTDVTMDKLHTYMADVRAQMVLPFDKD